MSSTRSVDGTRCGSSKTRKDAAEMLMRVAMVFGWIIVAGVHPCDAQEAAPPKQPTRLPPVKAAQAPLPQNRIAFRTATVPEHFATRGEGAPSDLSRAMLPSDSAPFDPIAADGVLSLPLLLNEVLAQHPSLSAAIAAWRAAAARYPQVVSLEDPMFDFMMAPGTMGSRDLDFAYVLQGRQKVPWCGKRPLRGAIVQHESQALAHEADDVRRRLIEVTQLAYFDYVMVGQLEQLNEGNRRAVESFRANAITRYESNLVSQQDVLLAEVELAKLERQTIELERQRRVAQARINTLLLRQPQSPLPPTSHLSEDIVSLPDVELLQAMAEQQRPDLAARRSRIRAAQASRALAEREYAPDLEYTGQYNTMWQGMDKPMQGQVGISLNVPLARASRAGAVREAAATVSQNRAELQNLSLDVQREVQEAFERLRESRGVLALYRDRIIPAAEQSVESAVAGYTTGNLDFLRLIEAERELISLREERVMAQLEYFNRLAELERVVAGPLIDSGVEELPPGPSVPLPDSAPQ